MHVNFLRRRFLAVFLAAVAAAGIGGAGEAFTDAFVAISPRDISESVFKLVGGDYSVITAGKIPQHNSMTASFGGFGILFGKPTTWNFLRSNRFTLEKIEQDNLFTMSYFPEKYQNEVLFFGSRSGRNSDKMRESRLTPVSTPSGAPAYMEAKLIIECRLTAINTVNPDDYLTEEGREFVEEGFADTGAYHKLVFAEIVTVWKRR